MVMQENVQLCSHDPITILMCCKTALQQRKVVMVTQIAEDESCLFPTAS